MLVATALSEPNATENAWAASRSVLMIGRRWHESEVSIESHPRGPPQPAAQVTPRDYRLRRGRTVVDTGLACHNSSPCLEPQGVRSSSGSIGSSEVATRRG